jgi:DNA polymerase-3 subunit epsilon
LVYIILHTVAVNKRKQVVVKIDLATGMEGDLEEQHFFIRPTVSITKKQLRDCRIEQSTLMRADSFYDVANDLIDAIAEQRVRFLSMYQYRLFVSEFKTIGYNCQLNYETLEATYKRLQVPSTDNDVTQLLAILSHNSEEDLKRLSAVEHLQKCYSYASALKSETSQDQNSTKMTLNRLHITQPLLPAPGVYYFKNAANEVIYVGKAKSLRNRLQSHFMHAKDENEEMYSEVSTIDLAYTGSDLIAQLLESHEIKSLAPKFNTQQVKTPAPYQILIKKNKRGVKRLVLEKKTYKDTDRELFYNRDSAKNRLRELCNIHDLCPKFCSLERIAGACSLSDTGDCRGVCDKREVVEVYNLRVDKAYETLINETLNKIIKVPGRTAGEHGFVLITNGIYQGFGFYNSSDKINTIADLEAFLFRYINNYDTIRIIDSLLKKIPKDRILDLEHLGW